jgi:hypothetical protein
VLYPAELRARGRNCYLSFSLKTSYLPEIFFLMTVSDE